jgi:hypothetical protein
MDDLKLNEIDKLTQSQIDRLNAKNIADTSLLNFMSLKIKEASEKDDLKKKLKKEFERRLYDSDNDKISDNMLVNMYEILSKEEIAKESNILNITKEQQKIEVNNHIKNNENSPKTIDAIVEEKNSQITKEDIKIAKEGIKKIDKIGSLLEEIDKAEGS